MNNKIQRNNTALREWFTFILCIYSGNSLIAPINDQILIIMAYGDEKHWTNFESCRQHLIK